LKLKELRPNLKNEKKNKRCEIKNKVQFYKLFQIKQTVKKTKTKSKELKISGLLWNFKWANMKIEGKENKVLKKRSLC
jgi:hypothetical protein